MIHTPKFTRNISIQHHPFISGCSHVPSNFIDNRGQGTVVMYRQAINRDLENNAACVEQLRSDDGVPYYLEF